MTVGRKILRMLLIAGLIPGIAGAGLLPRSCACEIPPAIAATDSCPCCLAGETSGCGQGMADCPCCRKAVERSCCEDQIAEAPTVECLCGGLVQVPTAPGSPTVELTGAAAISVVSLPAISLPSPLRRSVERDRSALLPVRDLPMTLCALLI